MAWVLILTFYASTMSDGDNLSIMSQEFSSKEKCEVAGKLSNSKFSTLMKSVKYICVEK